MYWERINPGLYRLFGCKLEIEITERERVWSVWIDGSKTAQEFHTLKAAKNFVSAVLDAAEGIAGTKFFENA